MSSTQDRHGTKRSASPNDEGENTQWSGADLGTDERRQKFLRLMGAGKREPTGRLVIGDHKSTSHFRSGTEDQRMNAELEQQYQQGLDGMLSGRNRRHVGLGFSEPEPPPPLAPEEPPAAAEKPHSPNPSNPSTDASKAPEPRDRSKSPSSSEQGSSAEEDEEEEEDEKDSADDDEEDDKKNGLKMTFVKSS
ncbi:small acidic protein isoform X2 [Engraulis encrasicolus]|uniref:small acidic protein isoform X2 n=1 Tax=Engraulis encrasicolus TaxID=184585 RepID=UPI002FD1748F